MLAHRESSRPANAQQVEYLHTFCVEHELESEIRSSSQIASSQEQIRLVKAKRARTRAEIICYNDVLAAENLGRNAGVFSENDCSENESSEDGCTSPSSDSDSEASA